MSSSPVRLARESSLTGSPPRQTTPHSGSERKRTADAAASTERRSQRIFASDGWAFERHPGGALERLLAHLPAARRRRRRAGRARRGSARAAGRARRRARRPPPCPSRRWRRPAPASPSARSIASGTDATVSRMISASSAGSISARSPSALHGVGRSTSASSSPSSPRPSALMRAVPMSSPMQDRASRRSRGDRLLDVEAPTGWITRRAGSRRPSRRSSAISAATQPSRRGSDWITSGGVISRSGSLDSSNEMSGSSMPAARMARIASRPVALCAAKIAVGGSEDASIAAMLASVSRPIGAGQHHQRRILGDPRLGQRHAISGQALLHRPEPRVVRERGDAPVAGGDQLAHGVGRADAILDDDGVDLDAFDRTIQRDRRRARARCRPRGTTHRRARE